MSRFNAAVKNNSKTVNKAGGEAFVESPELEFVSILLTSFVQNQYYRSADNTLDKVVELLDSARISGKFAAKAAVYARNEFGMRSISHVVAAELAHRVKGEGWMHRFVDRVVRRPDDMTEIVSYYNTKYGRRPIPNSLKKGLASAFAKFDEYQLAKYQAKNKGVSLVDVVNAVHPRPVKGNEGALKKLIAGTLKSKGTWESKLTEAGQKAENAEDKAELKREAWTELISSRKIGYFALLRNLRNILAQAPGAVEAACELLVDQKLIKKSLVLPFRYATAIKEIHKVMYDGNRNVMIALNNALDVSCSNVPVFDGKTLVALDVSGSMSGKPSEIGSLFAAILVKSNDADLILFKENAMYRNVNPMDSTLTIAGSLQFAMGGTNFHAIFDTAKRAYARIIILSGMQGWMGYDNPTGSFEKYKARCGTNPLVYSFDLSGYGSLQFPEPQVFAIAGFSEKIFDIMKLLEQDRNALVKTIEGVEL